VSLICVFTSVLIVSFQHKKAVLFEDMTQVAIVIMTKMCLRS